MIVYAIGAIVVLIAVIIAAQWFMQASPRTLATVVRYTVISAIGAGTAFLALTGRTALAFMLATGVIPFLKKWGMVGGPSERKSGGQVSEVVTDFIQMRLEHETGLMEGEVLKGRYRGRKMGDLSKEDLLSLLGECLASDQESARLVEAFLDKTYADWREGESRTHEKETPTSRSGGMTREEAFRVLGLEPSASTNEIRQAHRRLMQKVHPDLGGSGYLAAKLNEAKERLLGE